MQLITGRFSGCNRTPLKQRNSEWKPKVWESISAHSCSRDEVKHVTGKHTDKPNQAQTFWSSAYLCTRSSLKCAFLQQHLPSWRSLLSGTELVELFWPSLANEFSSRCTCSRSICTALLAISVSSTQTSRDAPAHLSHTHLPFRSSCFTQAACSRTQGSTLCRPSPLSPALQRRLQA